MLSLQDALQSLTEHNLFLQTGIANRLFNLSALARFLKPVIETKLKKNITATSLVMALSRHQKKRHKGSKLTQIKYRFSNIQAASNLCIISYSISPRRRQEVASFVRELQAKGEFISITQGLSQITIFLNKSAAAKIHHHVKGKPLSINRNIALVGGLFDPKLCQTPGFLNAVFQQLYLQNINIVEVASTYNELLIYVDEKDMKLAFETLYSRFVKQPT
ncbi:MAG TPA: hypothetical protein PKD37_04760 [Oligoflexia bacterium]|nr:hypothetical protein [Oligoflexia bacterium]HMP27276.1 hypothetical protein [Oligoflexia bacterium]